MAQDHRQQLQYNNSMHHFNNSGRIIRSGHTQFLFSGQKKFEISGDFSGHQNDVFTLK